jgi:ribosome-binding protein aMBF1 (putative translation factor)|nr:MAG TPA: Helix-turn-helix XRE-family like protein [Caudoviricetes sp.]
MTQYSTTKDNGEVTMRDLATGVTLQWMEGEPNTLRTTSMGNTRRSEYIRIAQAMTTYAYDHGLLGETTPSVLIKQAARQAVGQQVRQARETKGLTGQQLAERCGLAQPHIARIEAGRYNVTTDILAIIAHALGTEIIVK